MLHVCYIQEIQVISVFVVISKDVGAYRKRVKGRWDSCRKKLRKLADEGLYLTESEESD